MTLFIIFIIFLSAGIIHELQVIFNKETHALNHIIYSLGAVVFLFFEQPYILHGFVVTLAILGIIKESMQKSSEIAYLKGVLHYRDLNDEDGVRQEEDKNMIRMARITKGDAVISLVILIALAFHASMSLADFIIDIAR